MAPKLAQRIWVLAISGLLLLAGCGTWWQQQQQAWQRRQDQERCIKRRSAIEQQMALIRGAQQALRATTAQAYAPTPPPRPMDPELASRFSQLDRELDEERFKLAYLAWSRREQQRRKDWNRTQQQRRQQIDTQLSRHTADLAAIDPSLVTGGQPNDAKIARLSDCGPVSR